MRTKDAPITHEIPAYLRGLRQEENMGFRTSVLGTGGKEQINFFLLYLNITACEDVTVALGSEKQSDVFKCVT